MNLAEVAIPEQVAVHVVAVEPLRSEVCEDAFAVGRRSAVGVAPLPSVDAFNSTSINISLLHRYPVASIDKCV